MCWVLRFDFGIGMVLVDVFSVCLESMPNFHGKNPATFCLIFRGENTSALHRKCIISHKILFSPSFHCENMATGCLIFTVKIRQSFAFGALWRINRDDRAH